MKQQKTSVTKYLTCGHTDFETYLLGRLSLLEEKKDVVDGICYIHIYLNIYTQYLYIIINFSI